MKIALKEAKKSLDDGNYPVGAVLVINGKYIGKSINKITAHENSTSHAELQLIHRYSKLIKKHRIQKYKIEMYTTLEPCFMCFGTAIVHRITRIIYSCPDPTGGVTDLNPKLFKKWYQVHWPEIAGGLFKEESGDMLIERMKNTENKNWKKLLP